MARLFVRWALRFGALLISASTCFGQEMRTWTNADGRTVQAEFVRLDGETVEIKNDKGVFRVPLSTLSDTDQLYARRAAGKPEKKRPIKIVNREWTLFGAKVSARFVRLRDGNVQLLQGRQVVSHPILSFRGEDIEYLYAVLESRGDLEELKDDPNVQMVVAQAKGEREKAQLERERQVAAKEPAPPSTPPERDEASIDETPSPGIEIEPLGPPGSVEVVDRQWTLQEGVVTARLVGIPGNDILILENGAQRSVPILSLSREDIGYLFDVIQLRGLMRTGREAPAIHTIAELEIEARRLEPKQRRRLAAAEETPSFSSTSAGELPASESATTPSGGATGTPSSVATADASRSTSPSPSGPKAPLAAPSAPASRPAREGIHSDDPWERDRAVMGASNKAAYLFLSGILALLLLFGPIVYALQRMR